MKRLATLPSGVSETLELVGRFDQALMHGFARLGDDHRQGLDALTEVFAGSPLGEAVREAVESVGRAEFLPRSFLALASARVALLGAVHDALVAQVRTVLGRPGSVENENEFPSSRPPGSSATTLASTQQWLTELAISGLNHLEEPSVAPFAATLERLQATSDLVGLASLLTGFSNELLRGMSGSGSSSSKKQRDRPAFRWADLWSGAMVRTQELPAIPRFQEVAGTFTPLGLELQGHENFACAILHGIFDEGSARHVRIPLQSYKVGAISGPLIWDLFTPFAAPILSAIEGHKCLLISAGELREDGSLILRSAPKVGPASDPFAAAKGLTSLPTPPPLLRHPVHLAEPVHLTERTDLPLAVERLSDAPDLAKAVEEGASEMVGLLRFDRGGWRIQPLCARTKKGFLMNGEGIATARKKVKERPLDVLQERAGRLLRNKS